MYETIFILISRDFLGNFLPKSLMTKTKDNAQSSLMRSVRVWYGLCKKGGDPAK
jgi:hypothetical protein